MIKEEIFWHNLTWQKVAKILGSDPEKGLREKEVKLRQKKFGKNEVETEKPLSKPKLFLAQLKNPFVYLLTLAGLITLFLKEYTDSIVIFLAIFINAIFGFWQENKTSNIFKKLKKVLTIKCIVLREGQKKEISQSELVPGDIVFLKAGDKVPADARVIESRGLKVSEAILTGEWYPSEKKDCILPPTTPLADRENMVYWGSLVERGEGKAIVVATGKRTETGKIALLIEELKEEKSPLQKKIISFSKTIAFVISFVCIILFFIGTFQGKNLLQVFETSVAIAVGGVPEALPIVFTVILAVGVERILRKKGLIKKLTSVETLGSTQIICFDKTKTLTQGKMELKEVDSQNKKEIFIASTLCNEAFIENPSENPEKWILRGSPTDKALLKGAAKFGISPFELEKDYKEIAKLPFDPERKFALSLRKKGKEFCLFVCGAPERILERSQNKNHWKEKLDRWAKMGYRVVGAGQKRLEPDKVNNLKNLEDLAQGFEFLGLLILEDPLRPEVKRAIKICQEAGMKPVLVTGDNKFTAQTVAKEIGLEVSQENILEGKELDELSEKELDERLENIKVFARVEPKHKIRIVKAWKDKGKVVAMTGDGINDAPALKAADIGIALGSGAEVAKEAADLILINDSFEILIKTIEEGRVILDNIRKGITYVMANSFASALIVGLAFVLGWPIPILAVQILWNNIVEDSLPNIAYAFEPKEKGVMKRRPEKPGVSLLTKEMKILIFFTGLIYQSFGFLVFGYLWALKGLSLEYVRTMVLGVLVLNTAFVIFSYKSLRKNIWQYNPFSNKWLNGSAILIILFFAASIYLRPFQVLLKTVPLDFGSWLLLILVGVLSMATIEITKKLCIIKRIY